MKTRFLFYLSTIIIYFLGGCNPSSDMIHPLHNVEETPVNHEKLVEEYTVPPADAIAKEEIPLLPLVDIIPVQPIGIASPFLGLRFSGGGGPGRKAVCGNGSKEGTEQCDDGNTHSGDGCTSRCKLECGNGVVEPELGEECDDRNLINTDGCTNQCLQTLLAITGSGDVPSRLYVLNHVDGSIVEKLPFFTRWRHVTGLAVHPLNRTIYGYSSTSFQEGTEEFIIIDPITGRGACADGSDNPPGNCLSSPSGQGTTNDSAIADLTFDSTGQLYGWMGRFFNSLPGSDEDLLLIDPTSGAVSSPGDFGSPTSGPGLAFDVTTGNLYLKNQRDARLHIIDPNTGTSVSSIALSNNSSDNMLTTSALGQLYSGERTGDAFQLQTIDKVTGEVVNIGDEIDLSNIAALEFVPLP